MHLVWGPGGGVVAPLEAEYILIWELGRPMEVANSLEPNNTECLQSTVSVQQILQISA